MYEIILTCNYASTSYVIAHFIQNRNVTCDLQKNLKSRKRKEKERSISLSPSYEDVECVRNTMKDISNDVGIELLGNKNKSNLEKAKIIDILLYKRDLFKHAQTKGGIIQCSTE